MVTASKRIDEGQAEFWAKVGRAALDNPDLPASFISADMALRLSDFLGTSAEMWLGMQSAYDLWQAAQQPRPLVKRMVMAA